MIAENIKIGMRVVPIRSTHPKGWRMDELLKYDRFEKGYVIVCEVSPRVFHEINPNPITVYCHTRGRAARRWQWYRFLPEDLEPANANSMWCLQEMILNAKLEEGD